ncbi:MAG: group II intron reverse transcriptase/maturase [Bacteroidales bacterium]|nr:group II intron reverse transcriptase/maturase [Bacteroidales bacterium]
MNRHKRCALKTLITTWNLIPWNKVYKRVRSLQRRIAKAISEGYRNKACALQWLLTHSFAAKLLAVKRVTENKGKNTPGVDGVLWKTSKDKLKATNSLIRQGYTVKPLRRVYIKKKNGKERPLGIPTMKDRAMQALFLSGLDPVSETTADFSSYGFRRKRSCHDAIARCYIHLSRNDSATWILEADIKGCFDNISHDWIINNILTDKRIVTKWLKAGFIDNNKLFPTKAGTPQGGIISPTIANMVLDGLEEAIYKCVNTRIRQYDGCRRNYHKIHFVRYADDFIVTGASEDILRNVVKPVIADFLNERGLTLSETKTKITDVYTGFDFLGQNIRKFSNGKLLIRPSKENFKAVLSKIKFIIIKHRGAPTVDLIHRLNSVITGWSNYHKRIVAAEYFVDLDRFIWFYLWKWAKRRHSNKGYYWIANKYFKKVGNRKWTFFGTFYNRTEILLKYASDTQIKRHVLINGKANPYCALWDKYYRRRFAMSLTA